VAEFAGVPAVVGCAATSKVRDTRITATLAPHMLNEIVYVRAVTESTCDKTAGLACGDRDVQLAWPGQPGLGRARRLQPCRNPSPAGQPGEVHVSPGRRVQAGDVEAYGAGNRP
jgi:hypothetical protein